MCTHVVYKLIFKFLYFNNGDMTDIFLIYLKFRYILKYYLHQKITIKKCTIKLY